MVYLAIGILYLIAVILGTWSASLFWRAWHAWRLDRRARRKEQAPVTILSIRRRRFALLVAIFALPLAGFAFSYAEIVRADPDKHQELGVVVARAVMGMCLFLAAGALYVSYRFDPSQGRRRCGKCWYDMSATEGLMCPECGHEPRGENGLFQTRRAPRLVWVAALLMALSYGVWVTPRMFQRGSAAGVPTTALIALLPWAPETWIEQGPASLSTRSADEELWDWQTRLLRWRARGVVRSSPDFKAVRRASAFVWQDLLTSGSDAAPRVTMHPRALLAYIRESCDPMAPPSSARMPGGAFDYRLAGLIPDNIDPLIADEAESILRAAMESGSEDALLGATAWAPLLGQRSACLTGLLEAHINDPDASPLARTSCVLALRGALADQEAWRVAVAAARANDAEIRAAALRVLGSSTGRDDHVSGIAREMMNDTDDRVASAAASAYLRRLPSPCSAVDELLDLVRQRPAVGVHVVETLARDCLDERVVEMISIMLASKARDESFAATSAAEVTGALGAPLLPRLKELADARLHPPSNWMALRAIELIQAAIKGTPPVGPEAQ